MNTKQSTLLFLATLFVLGLPTTFAAPKVQKRMSPEQLIGNLYWQHKKRSPFFQKTNRALLDRYFEKELADLLWKDVQGSGGEVGALDGDPLFNAQDMDIKKFAIHKAESSDANGGAGQNKATVTVTFENFGQPHSVYFDVSRSSPSGPWKIWDIRYDDGSKLTTILKQGN